MGIILFHCVKMDILAFLEMSKYTSVNSHEWTPEIGNYVWDVEFFFFLTTIYGLAKIEFVNLFYSHVRGLDKNLIPKMCTAF